MRVRVIAPPGSATTRYSRSTREELEGSVPALSTHGDVIAELIGWDQPCKKGSIWVLAVEGVEIGLETYLPPA